MILDPDTYALVNAIDDLLEDSPNGEIKPELMESVLEISTNPCADLREAEESLRALRRQVRETAEKQGLCIGSAGTHPLARWEDQRITAAPRYRDLIEALRFVARQEIIFGLHVHIGLDDADKAIHVANGMRVHVPILLALSANSPFWRGDDTGLARRGCRSSAPFPASASRPTTPAGTTIERRIAFMVEAGVMEDYTWLWYDVRPHPNFGTVEIRAMDAQTHVEHTLALAALIQAMVKELAEHYDAGWQLSYYPYEMLDENKWLASRHGLEGAARRSARARDGDLQGAGAAALRPAQGARPGSRRRPMRSRASSTCSSTATAPTASARCTRRTAISPSCCRTSSPPRRPDGRPRLNVRGAVLGGVSLIAPHVERPGPVPRLQELRRRSVSVHHGVPLLRNADSEARAQARSGRRAEGTPPRALTAAAATPEARRDPRYPRRPPAVRRVGARARVRADHARHQVEPALDDATSSTASAWMSPGARSRRCSPTGPPATRRSPWGPSRCSAGCSNAGTAGGPRCCSSWPPARVARTSPSKSPAGPRARGQRRRARHARGLDHARRARPPPRRGGRERPAGRAGHRRCPRAAPARDHARRAGSPAWPAA